MWAHDIMAETAPTNTDVSCVPLLKKTHEEERLSLTFHFLHHNAAWMLDDGPSSEYLPYSSAVI